MSSTHLPGPNKRLWLVGIVAFPTVLAFIVWVGDGGPATEAALALVASAVLLVAAILLLEASGRQDPNPARKRLGYLTVLLGADGRLSTSKAVLGIWTLLLAAALTFLGALTVFGDIGPEKAFGGDWNGYFLLLGGPFASAVLAKGVTVAAIRNDPSSKTTTPAASADAEPTAAADPQAEPSLTDLVQGDASSTDLIDTQYVVFSLVAISYFVMQMVGRIVDYAHGGDDAKISLPTIPSALLGLTSLAALTYVGNKAIATRGVRIAVITPNPAAVGGNVTVTVVNLPPGASANDTSVVLVDANQQTTTTAPTAVAGQSVTFVAPAQTGTYQLSIRGPSYVSPTMPMVVQ